MCCEAHIQVLELSDYSDFSFASNFVSLLLSDSLFAAFDEKEVKKDAKELKKTGTGSLMSFKPSSVSASESSKKAKLMADSVRSSSTTTIKTVQVPQSTKDRMLGTKTDNMER